MRNQADHASCPRWSSQKPLRAELPVSCSQQQAIAKKVMRLRAAVTEQPVTIYHRQIERDNLKGNCSIGRRLVDDDYAMQQG